MHWTELKVEMTLKFGMEQDAQFLGQAENENSSYLAI